MFDDIETKDFDSVPTKPDAEIVKTNKANGFLEHAADYAREYLENCPACRGSGNWTGGWNGSCVRKCFKCKGTGSLSFKTSPDQRAKAKVYSVNAKIKKTNEQADVGAAYLESNPLIKDWIIETHSWNDFASAMLTAVGKYGSLTPKQLAAAEKSANKHNEKKVSRAEHEEKTSVQIDTAGLEPILNAFADAKGNGLKRPKMRLDGFQLSLAPDHGVNAGNIYVKDGELYLGKINPEGKFLKPHNLSAEDSAYIDAKLIEVGSNPMEAAVAYGRRTGSCSCCGRTLTDPVSVDRGIGPICAENFGF